MRVAFYAPLKPPTHPVPSGDRRVARALMAALEATGRTVELASRLRSWSDGANPARQARLEMLGGRLADRLVRRYLARPPAKRPTVWFTYHLYHKAPDWLGPVVADALGIPYVVAEASHAPRRAEGPWAGGHRAAAAAIARADAVIALNGNDVPGVLPLLTGPERLIRLAPFLDTAPLATASAAREAHRGQLARSLALDPGLPWLLAVGMMRDGDKLASYRLLAAALAQLADRPWALLVAGDGPKRAAVEALFEPWAAGRVRWLAALAPDGLAGCYAAADLMVWPAINEAFGMALLEAQAAGLPVVAGRSGGVGEIVRDGRTGLLAPVGDPDALAAAVATLLDDPARRAAMGREAAAVAAAEHDTNGAAAVLDHLLRRLGT